MPRASLARTVRPPGLIVAGAAALGLALGVLFGWTEFLVAGAASVLLLGVSLPFLRGSRAYQVSLQVAERQLVAGDALDASVSVRHVGRGWALPGRVELPVGDAVVEVAVPALRAGTEVTEPLAVDGLRRGVLRVGPATTVRSDPLGLLRREHTFADARLLRVHPRTVALSALSTGLIRDLEGVSTGQLTDADMSFHAIREYAAGDARRLLHAKSTAKTGQLMVRQYDQTRRARLTVVLGVGEAEYTDADEFELAVSAAASLAVRAVRDGRDTDLVVGTGPGRVLRGRQPQVRHLPAASPGAALDAYTALDPLPDSLTLEEVCRLAGEHAPETSLAVVVTGSALPLARLQRIRLALPVDAAVLVISCDQGAHPRRRVLHRMAVLTIATLDDLSGLLLREAAS